MVFSSFFAYGEDEHRRGEQVGAGSQLGVKHLLAEIEGGGAHVAFVSPVSTEFSEPVLSTSQVQHAAGILFQHHGLLFSVYNFGVCLDDIFIGIGREVQAHLGAVNLVLQGDDGMLASVSSSFLLMLYVSEQGGGVTVGMAHVNGRLKIVLHSVCQVGFCSAWQMLQVCFICEMATHVRLVEASVSAHSEHNVRALGAYTDELIGMRQCGHTKQSRK